jgi:hypothetical protein
MKSALRTEHDNAGVVNFDQRQFHVLSYIQEPDVES